MKLLGLLLWLLVPAALWLAATLWGTPHVLLSYTYRGAEGRWIPAAERVHRDCAYVGWTGRRSAAAYHGRCAWLRFYTSERGR
ncbi:MAG: hypothetical protein AAFU61_10130 [Pseudomonadota bacterium]